MSTNETAGIHEQVDPALANVMSHVYRPRFFAKLAALGVQPSNEAEAETLIDLGFKLAELGMTVPKAAPANAGQPQGQNKFASAVDALVRLQYSDEQLADHQRKLAAQQLAQDPTLLASAMVLQAVEDQAAAAA